MSTEDGQEGLSGTQKVAMGNTQALGEVASKAPHWAAIIIVVALFLWYMERSRASAELVATQRIETCHEVQDKSTEAVKELKDALVAWSRADAEMNATLQRLISEIR